MHYNQVNVLIAIMFHQNLVQVPEGLSCMSGPWILVGFVAVAGTVASVVA